MNERVSAGSPILDKLLDGGYEKGIISTIYGPGGSGKTNLCMLCVKKVLESGRKVIYIDTEGSFSMDRFRQICRNDKKLTDEIIFLMPASFEEQRNVLSSLKSNMSDKIGLVVVDTITTLYRLEAGENIYETNRLFGLQLSNLFEIACRNNIPVLITSQVYASMKSNSDEVKLVGGDILRHSSKCLIELKKENSHRTATIAYHRSIPEGKKASFRIIEAGISAV